MLPDHLLNATEPEKVLDSGKKASTTAIYLGRGLLGRSKEAQHEGHFYLYKSRPKGRQFKRSKERAVRATVTAKARTAGKSPWFIFTNSTDFLPRQVMKLYSRRMQIEQNFRDEKNPRWGFGLRFGASHSAERVAVLSLIATLASIIMWLSGFCFENKGIHSKYQANTVKHRRVVSLLKLAENVFRHSPAHIENPVAGLGTEEITAKVYRYDFGLLNFLGIPQRFTPQWRSRIKKRPHWKISSLRT